MKNLLIATGAGVLGLVLLVACGTSAGTGTSPPTPVLPSAASATSAAMPGSVSAPLKWTEKGSADGVVVSVAEPVLSHGTATFTVTVTNMVPALLTGVSLDQITVNGLGVDSGNFSGQGSDLAVVNGQTVTVTQTFENMPDHATVMTVEVYVNHDNSVPANQRLIFTGPAKS